MPLTCPQCPEFPFRGFRPADWPTECAWFYQDLPGVRYLDWFLQGGNPHFERWIMGLTLKRIGEADGGLSEELAEMVRSGPPATEPQWLELYARARRFEDVGSICRRIWLGELRSGYERQAVELIRSKAHSADARWTDLRHWASQCAAPGKAIHAGKIAELRSAIELLTTALPGRFSVADDLQKQIADSGPKWNGVLSAIAKQDEKALAALPAISEEILAARRSLLRSLAGMEEFLDQWQAVSLETEWEEQFAVLSDELANREWFDKVADQTLRPEALILPGDRDPTDVVLRRTAALLADVKRLGGSDLAEAELHLAALQKAVAAIGPDHGEARYLLYADLCRLRRQIAFRNPLLDFSELLFVKRHRAIYPHMCDQYYGIAARPGGGLYVLSNPFGPDQRLRDVLADGLVGNGRLKGQKLSGGPNKPWNIRYDGIGHLTGDETEGGSFLSPDLSRDGNSIVFAYVECTGDRKHVHHTDPSRGHWAEGRCYHIFRVNVDGSDLEQFSS